MVARSRTNIGEFISGYRTSYAGNRFDVTRNCLHESVNDQVAPGDGHAFSVRRFTCDPFVLNGKDTNLASKASYHNYPIMNAQVARHLPLSLATQSDGAYAALLLKLTNPSRPVVDLPVFIAELRDIPLLFKVIGDTALKTLSRANLSFWFGWKPLANDLMQMMDFSDVVNKRANEIKQLHKTGLSCTRTLDTLSVHADPVVEALSDWNGVSLSRAKVTQARIWGHVKWKPTTVPPRTDQEYINLARRAAFGLTIDPATAWELIPFSWMVDWFSSVGNFLSAQRNIVGAIPTNLSIMRNTKTTTTYAQTNPGYWLKCTGSQAVCEDKIRNPAVASLDAHLPVLTARQLSILGSLAVLKADKVGLRFR